MTYFDPVIYNEDNLTDADRAEVNFWWENFQNAMLEAEDMLLDDDGEPEDILNQIQLAVVRRFEKKLKRCLASRITDYIVARIDNYPAEEEG